MRTLRTHTVRPHSCDYHLDFDFGRETKQQLPSLPCPVPIRTAESIPVLMAHGQVSPTNPTAHDASDKKTQVSLVLQGNRPGYKKCWKRPKTHSKLSHKQARHSSPVLPSGWWGICRHNDKTTQRLQRTQRTESRDTVQLGHGIWPAPASRVQGNAWLCMMKLSHQGHSRVAPLSDSPHSTGLLR